ncbi:MAG: hypothetical protein KDH96_13115, partial [Candidatus Riesia sp.]|nr:hypothetical protein [Candidatus Riesia sp.]
ADYIFISPSVDTLADSPFIYPSWKVMANFSERYETINNRYGISDWNKDIEFDLTPQDSFIIGKVWLKIERGPLSRVGGTYARFIPNEGYMALEKVTFTQGTELLQTRDSFMKIIEYDSEMSDYEQRNERELAFADLTVPERDATSAVSSVLYVDLTPWWTKWSRMYLKTGIIGTPIRIKGKLRALNDMVDTDANSVSCPITSISLLTQSFEVMSNEKALHLSNSLKKGGIQFRTFDYQTQEHFLAAGDSSYKIKLDNLTLPSNAIFFFILKNSDLSSTLPNPGHRYDNYIPVKTAKMTAGQVDVTRIHTDKELKYIIGARSIGFRGRNIYCLPFSLDVANIQAASGHKTPARMNTPVLELTFDAPLAE